MEKDDAGEMVSILVVEEDDEEENREDVVQHREAGQGELGQEMSAGGGKVEEDIESLEKKKGIENGREESPALDERNPRRAAVGTN